MKLSFTTTTLLDVDVVLLANEYLEEVPNYPDGSEDYPISQFVSEYVDSLEDVYADADNRYDCEAILTEAVLAEVELIKKEETEKETQTEKKTQTENDKIYVIRTNYADESFATFSPESAKNYISDYWETMFEYHENCDDDEIRAIFSGRLQKYIQDALDGKNPWNPFSYGDMECEVLTLNHQRDGYTPADGNKN